MPDVVKIRNETPMDSAQSENNRVELRLGAE